MEFEGSLSVCDMRIVRGAEKEASHIFVRAKIRLKIRRSKKTKNGEIKKWDISKLNKKEVIEEFTKEVAANVKNSITRSGRYK